MTTQTHHAVLPEATHDEFARQSFAAAMRKFFTEELFPGNAQLYHERLRPAFEARHGRPPKTAKEVGTLLAGTYYYQGGALVGRATQELLWEEVGESIERQLEALKARLPEGPTCGSLRVDTAMRQPDYIQAVDIHAMPGNYHTELGENDIFAGALYDRGVHVFAYGGLGPLNEALGDAYVAFFRQHFPEARPRRILDMGCGCGFSTLPFARAFPDAEVHGIDVGAPMLRYGHARAESLRVPVHFSQQDATRETGFEAGSFDLVYSCLVHHEMPAQAIEGTIREGFRLLAPGGIMLHDGARTPSDADPLSVFLEGWFTRNVNEPFSKATGKIDFEAMCIAAGFRREDLFYGEFEQVYLKGQLPPIPFRGAVRR